MVAAAPTGLNAAARTAVLMALLLGAAACEEWYLSISSEGLVFVSVSGDTDALRHRFRVRTRDAGGATRTIDLPPSRELALRPGVDGAFMLNLLPPSGCQVEGANPRTVMVAMGRENRLVFDVRCSAG